MASEPGALFVFVQLYFNRNFGERPRRPNNNPILSDFRARPQHVLNRDQLLDLTQGREAEVFDRSIDLLVSRLRQRLRDDAREPSYIKTVRSEGYVFAASVEALQEPS